MITALIISGIIYLIIARIAINLMDWSDSHFTTINVSCMKFSEGYRIILMLIFPVVVLWFIVVNIGDYISQKMAQ